MKYWLVLLFILFIGNLKAQKYDQDLNNIQVTWQLINSFYVDSIDRSAFAEKTIRSMLSSLDPHSVYIPADEVKEANEALDGNFEGVGIEFLILKDTLTVISTINGGPSQKVGIRSGDRILFINGEKVASVGINSDDVYAMLRGRKGTEVDFTIVRRGEDKMLDFSVVRDEVPIPSIEASYMADATNGYIKISRFAANTHKEFYDVLKKLKKDGMENLILDLRGNTGGYMSSALAILDQFLDRGQLMVYTEGATLSRHDHKATSKGLWIDGGLVVLIDENSASASEIVAGAVQDWDRGAIVGRRSYGKGLVQRPFTLTDGSEVRLTIAKYYTPSGRCIQKPYTDDKDSYKKEVFDRYSQGELWNEDSIHVNETLKYKTLVTERTVFGGGGILPDFFVPLDTIGYSDYYRDLVVNGVLSSVALDFYNNNETQWKDVKSFIQDFVVDDVLMARVQKEASMAGLTIDAVADRLIALQLKALIARNFWDNSAYYEIINPTVGAYQKAIQLFADHNEELVRP
jgi:carboxyl-terminal processing protease